MSFYEELTALMQKYAPEPDKLSPDPENKNESGNVEPGTDNHEPATENQEPASNNHEPGTPNQELQTQDQPTSGTLEANIQWLKDVLYRPAPEPTRDPVEEFLDRPDGPLARYSLHVGKESK